MAPKPHYYGRIARSQVEQQGRKVNATFIKRNDSGLTIVFLVRDSESFSLNQEVTHMNKWITLLFASMLIGGVLVGCQPAEGDTSGGATSTKTDEKKDEGAMDNKTEGTMETKTDGGATTTEGGATTGTPEGGATTGTPEGGAAGSTDGHSSTDAPAGGEAAPKTDGGADTGATKTDDKGAADTGGH